MNRHGPTYYQRYPKEMKCFTPTCDRSDIENCTDEEIQNVYDNTIVYTDWVMKQLIGKLENLQNEYQVALMYLFDHGESLGENGFYLHGTPFSFAPQEQTHVPWMMWFGDEFAQKRNIDTKALQKKVDIKQYTQDYLFSSLLSLMRVATKELNKNLSLF